MGGHLVTVSQAELRGNQVAFHGIFGDVSACAFCYVSLLRQSRFSQQPFTSAQFTHMRGLEELNGLPT